MSNEVIAAIIGAVAGAVSGGIVTWLLQRGQTRDQRNWDIALRASQVLGSILSAYTPDALKTKEDVWQLQQQWGERAREFSLLGWDFHRSDSPFSQTLNDYFQALLAYVNGTMKRGELEHRRSHCRQMVEDMIRTQTRR